MIKVLIVEDEYTARMFLSSFIQWEKYNMTLVGAVSNGEEALEVIGKEEVHLVISDLRMPKMDGITLLKELNSRGFQGEFIVLSNYSEFELVKEAMKEGAFDYLLKVTITEEELVTLLKKAIVELHLDEKDEKNNFLSSSEEKVQVIEYATNFLNGRASLNRNHAFEEKHFSRFTLMYIRYGLTKTSTFDQEVQVNTYFTNMISNLSTDLDVNRLLVVNIGRNEMVLFVFNQHQKVGNIEPLKEILMKQLKTFFNLTVEMLETKVCYCLESAAEFVSHLQNQKDYMIQGKLLDCRQEVKQIISYVSENLHEKIMLDDLAKLLNMNKSYMSRMFKEETTMTLSEFITYKKLEKARELLKNREIRIKDVAMEVGIYDQLYFSRLFTKTYGETPKQFKEKYFVN